VLWTVRWIVCGLADGNVDRMVPDKALDRVDDAIYLSWLQVQRIEPIVGSDTPLTSLLASCGETEIFRR